MKEILLNKDWYFHRGDIDVTQSNARGLPYINAKTERYHQGPASRLYVPTVDGHSYNRLYTADRWEKVELPHDYVIGDVTEEKNDRALGFVKYDNAWYRRRFTLPEEWRGKRITLLFHGVATRSTVYLNGCLAGRSFTGYCPFEVDISDICLFGEGKDNVLAVYVNTEEHEGWWYEGAGIYRDVYLRVYDPVSVDLWGVYVAPRRTENGWEAPVEVTVRNDSYRRRLVKLKISVKDTDGISVAESETNCYIDASAVKPVSTVLKFGNVKLWSPETPDMYICTAEVVSGEYSDEQKVRFGFRTFSVDPEKGLFINGKHYKIKGVCGHADCGLTGKAVPDNIHRYKVSLMKEMGANGYRCSHYPQAEALMDALDENGFIVMDETRWFDTSEEAVKQLKTLVKRDRNRPGVFFWSVGNEEPFQSEDRGRRIFRRLYEEVRKLDATRPILSAVDDPMHSEVFDDADVIGINYHLETYVKIHEKYPDKPILASECCATGTTRGHYFEPDDGRAFLPAWDRDTSSQFRSREYTWKYVSENDWITGMYQWIAFEHRGEATWPRICSQSGAVDLYLQKKDAFYQNMSFWTKKPMIHLLPHWNFEGLEGELFTVRAYTNCEEAELFLDGESLGRQSVGAASHGEWEVAYKPGKLSVVGYIGGKAAAADEKITSGRAYRLCLEQQTEDVCANGRDIALFSCYVTDENGNEVYDASPTVHFHTAGGCRVYSTGSDITDRSSLFSSVRRMRAGRIGVAVKLGTDPAGMKLYAEAEGLKSTAVIIKVK